MATTQSATIERYPTKTVLAVYEENDGRKSVIDITEAPLRDLEARLQNLFPSAVVEEVFYNAEGQVLPISVWWINHNYYSQEQFVDLRQARDYVRGRCFEATFVVGQNRQRGAIVASWSPIGGYREMN